MPSATQAPNKGLRWTLQWLVILTLLTLVIDEYCTSSLWQPNGLKRLQQLVDYDLARASDHRTFLGNGQQSGEFAVASANNLYRIGFELTGIHDMGLRFAQPEPLDGPGSTLRRFFLEWDLQIKTAMIGLQDFGVRLGVMLLALPLFAITGAVGLADGLAQRNIRKACGGRESSFLYHHFKHAMHVAFIAMWAVYLCVPVAMNPQWVLPPFALFFGVCARFAAYWFKKYV